VLEVKSLDMLPTGSTGSGIEGNLPLGDLWATLPTLSGCVTERIPGRVMFEHGIEDSEQLAHGGNQRDLGRFTALAQALVKSTQCRLMTDCGQGRHIERGTHLRAAAEDRAWAAPRPALTVERCDSRQGCGLASVEATQLGKASKQGGAGDRPYAWNGAQQRPGRTELGRFTQLEFDSLVDRSKFMLERADSTLEALADRFGHLLAAVTLSAPGKASPSAMIKAWQAASSCALSSARLRTFGIGTQWLRRKPCDLAPTQPVRIHHPSCLPVSLHGFHPHPLPLRQKARLLYLGPRRACCYHKGRRRFNEEITIWKAATKRHK